MSASAPPGTSERFLPRPRRRVHPFTIGAVVLLLLGGGCYAWMHRMTTYRVHAYKPAEEVRRGDPEELRMRLSAFPDPAANIELEWYSYDNKVINRPPYKLFIRIEPRVPDLQRVMVDEVRIQSSLGRVHEFADTIRWPVAIPIDHEEGYGTALLEPAFMFGYGEGEEITTRIRLRMVTTSGERSVVLETRWLPVRVTRFTSVV
jgi:hypothetical protein